MLDRSPHSTRVGDSGFTLVELMSVVLIIGVLVSIAIPVFNNTRAVVEKRTCYANQRAIEGVMVVWTVNDPKNELADAAGVVNSTNPIVANRLLRPPHCPVAPYPVDPMNPTAAEGVYTLNTSGTVLPCAFSSYGVTHGSFHGP